MKIPREYLFYQWNAPSSTTALLTQQALSQLNALPAKQSLLSVISDKLNQELKHPSDKPLLKLEPMAAALNMSPATLKRQLKRHGTQFQHLLDHARLHRALHLIVYQNLSADAVAVQLGFHDSAVFRRSFKRWTGATPSQLYRQITN